MAQRVGSNNSSDWAIAVRCVHDFSLGVQDEVSRVDDFSPLFPEGADLIGISWNLEAVPNREIQLQLLHSLFGLI